jgi:hypothetical protein
MPAVYALSPEQRVALLDHELRNLRARHDEGMILLGGNEGNLLWEATVDAFVVGNWVATLLCAQATCERVLAALVSLHELPGYGDATPKNWEKAWGLGKILGHVQAQGWVEPELLADVSRLSELRKPFGHWRRPLEPGTPGRRVVDHLADDEFASPTELTSQLLADDAAFAAITALRLYFGNYFGGPFEPGRASPPT